MALAVTLTPDPSDPVHGQPVTIRAVVRDTVTNATPNRVLNFAWAIKSGGGRLVGATDQPNVEYLADIPGNLQATVVITCTVTAPQTTPTVSSATLTSMDELGITGQLVNMLITATRTSSDLFNHNDANAIDVNSDTVLTNNLSITRIRLFSTSVFVYKESGSPGFNTYFTDAVKGQLSFYFIDANGRVAEFSASLITLATNTLISINTSGSFSQRAILTGISTGDKFVFGIADTGSIGLAAESVSQDLSLTVAPNTRPVIRLTLPLSVESGSTVPITAAITDPDETITTGTWVLGDQHADSGSIDDVNALMAMYTAPVLQPGSNDIDVAISFSAVDSDGATGMASGSISITAPPIIGPTVTLTVPASVDSGGSVPISATVTHPTDTITTVEWTLDDQHADPGSIADSTTLSTMYTAPVLEAGYDPISIIIRCRALDSMGTEGNAEATINVNRPVPPNVAPTINVVSIPSIMNAGSTVDVEVSVIDDNVGDTFTILWEIAPEGGEYISTPFGDSSQAATTLEVPSGIGGYTIRVTATDDHDPPASSMVTRRVDVFEAVPVSDVLSYHIGYDELIGHNHPLVLSANVEDAEGNTPDGLTYEWILDGDGSLSTPRNQVTVTYTSPQAQDDPIIARIQCQVAVPEPATLLEQSVFIRIPGRLVPSSSPFSRRIIHPIIDKINKSLLDRIANNTGFNKIDGIEEKPREAFGVVEFNIDLGRDNVSMGSTSDMYPYQRFRPKKVVVNLADRINGVDRFTNGVYTVMLHHIRDEVVGEDGRTYPSYSVYDKSATSFKIAYEEGITPAAFEEGSDIRTLTVKIAWFAKGW